MNKDTPKKTLFFEQNENVRKLGTSVAGKFYLN